MILMKWIVIILFCIILIDILVVNKKCKKTYNEIGNFKKKPQETDDLYKWYNRTHKQ